MFGTDPYVEQVAVLGDKRNYVSALVVPSFPALEQHARENGIPFASREELVSRPEIVAFYEARIQGVNEHLAGYEQIKRFTLMPREFTQDGGELTPTLKIKRRFVEQKYRATIDAMYAGTSTTHRGRRPRLTSPAGQPGSQFLRVRTKSPMRWSLRVT